MPARAWIAACAAKVTLLAVLAVAAPRAASACGPGEWVNPLPQGNNLWGATYVPGLWVAVGNAGTILTSPDATTWTAQHVDPGTWFSSAASDGSRTVAVGGLELPGGGTPRATVWTSQDGQSWQLGQAPDAPVFVAVTWDGTRFVAVANDLSPFWPGSQLFASADGVTWVPASEPMALRLEAVLAQSGLRVAVGARCAPEPIGTCAWRSSITVSRDGGPWVDVTLPETAEYGSLTGIADGGGRLVAVGSIGFALTSDDGFVWRSHETGGRTFARVVWADGSFIALDTSDNTLARSVDGESWSASGDPLPFQAFALAAGDSQVVAAGWAGGLARSEDTVVWTRVSSGDISWLSAVTSGAGRLVAVGSSGTILASPGGRAWTKVAGGTGDWFTIAAWGGLRFVAAGRAGVTATSTDGVNWVQGSIPDNPGPVSIAWGSGVFVVAGGRNAISTSSNGLSWTTTNLGADVELSRVVFTRGAFYAFGYAGAYPKFESVVTSPDGFSWSAPTRIEGAYDIPRFVAASDERFVAVGEGGFIASEDAMTWRPVWQVAEPLGRVSWAGGRFMAFGSSRVVYTSLDGLTWAAGEAIRLTDKGVADVTFDGTAVVAVGDGGTILRAPCVPPYAVRPHLGRAEPRRGPRVPGPLLR
ncbi:MAG: hypothetical protein HY825_09320 [Acidobacteria bacterium]|nr:hypothetical protein [Acidobacteriota bacterium]